MMFNRDDWYWRVANDPTKVYSSKRNIYVNPALDADFQTWMQSQGVTSAIPIASEAEVYDYVKEILPPWVLDPATGSFAYPGTNMWTKGQLKNYSLTRRVHYENSGMNSTTAGARLRTDDPAKQLVSIAADQARGNPGYMSRAISHDGITQFNAGDIVAIEKELADFIEAVFNVYATLDGSITGGTVATLADIDAAYVAVAPPPP